MIVTLFGAGEAVREVTEAAAPWLAAAGLAGFLLRWLGEYAKSMMDSATASQKEWPALYERAKGALDEAEAEHVKDLERIKAECEAKLATLHRQLQALEKIVLKLYEIAPQERLPPDLWVEKLKVDLDLHDHHDEEKQ